MKECCEIGETKFVDPNVAGKTKFWDDSEEYYKRMREKGRSKKECMNHMEYHW